MGMTTVYDVGGNTVTPSHEDGVPNGQGAITYGYGGQYVGDFRDGKRHAKALILQQMGPFGVANGRTVDF
jgi:hypothetical protein